MRQKPARHAPREHVPRAKPQHAHDTCEDKEYDGDREDRARQRGVAGGGIGFLDGGAKMAAGGWLGAKCLHDAHGAEAFRGIGAGFGERILRGARALADQAAGGHERQNDNRNGNQHGGGKDRARIDHQGDRADEQQ